MANNAIFFKGDWTHPFDVAHTRSAPFHLAGGGTAMVPMMARTGPAWLHAAADGTIVLEQLYGREAFAMTFVLPPTGSDVDALIAGLTTERWTGWLDALSSARSVRRSRGQRR